MSEGGARKAKGTGMADRVDAAEQAESVRRFLDLEPLGDDRFLARWSQRNFYGAIFGGQVMAHALAAACRTVGDWPLHSCNGYFVRRGDATEPAEYRVTTIADSRRFATRRVQGFQKDRQFFELSCSFHDPEPGFAHRLPDITGLPDPDALPNLDGFVTEAAAEITDTFVRHFTEHFPVEVRPFDAREMFMERLDPPQRDFWFRLRGGDWPADPQAHQCLFAMMSDYWMSMVAQAPHFALAEPARASVNSYSHHVWFHGAAPADQWFLYRSESPWAGEGRGMVRGLIHDRAGRLVATTMQEVVMRLT